MPGDGLEERFRVHARYIEGLAWVAGLTIGTTEARALRELKSGAAASGIVSDVGTTTDFDEVRTRLRNAWGTELMLAMSSRWDIDEEFVRQTNTWGVVQAYYVGYHMTQALVVARGEPRPTSHQKTQNLFVTLWCGRRAVLGPWTLGYGRNGPCNAPATATIDRDIHGWSRCDRDSCWSLAAKAVRTTRDDKVKDSLRNKRVEKQRRRDREWDEEEARRLQAGRRARRNRPTSVPQLTRAEKTSVDQRVRDHSMLDYLYRLRVSANYEDSALFTEGPTEDFDSAVLNRHLRYLAASTSLVTELRVRKLVGKRRMLKWADDFIAHNIPARMTVGVAARRDLFSRVGPLRGDPLRPLTQPGSLRGCR